MGHFRKSARTANTARITTATMPFRCRNARKITLAFSILCPYPSLCSSIIFLSSFASFLEIFFPPRNAVINPGSDPSNVRSTKYRDSSACTCSFGIKTETVASSLAMYPFHTFSVQPYKSWIFPAKLFLT